MNDFVNPQHRGVSLPPGYKDLIDVLEGKRRIPESLLGKKPIVKHFESGGLSHVEAFLSLLQNPMSKRASLVFLGCDRVLFVLNRSEDSLQALISFDTGDLISERAVRQIFAGVGIIPSSEVVLPEKNVQAFCYPIALEAANVVSLVTALLREAFGISDSDGLGFVFFSSDELP